MHRHQKPAFTLIELLVVIAIIAIIAAILFPVFARVREKGRQAVCLSNMKQIGAAVMMYIQDYDETMPFVLDNNANDDEDANYGDGFKYPLVRGVTGQEPRFQLVTLVTPYIKNASVWYCPSVGPDYHWEIWKKGLTMRDQGTTYAYNYLAGPIPPNPHPWIFLGGKPYAIFLDASRWPMLWEQPSGYKFTGNLADPPASAVPHSGGMNLAYGDGHAKFRRMETANGSTMVRIGDGLFDGQ